MAKLSKSLILKLIIIFTALLILIVAIKLYFSDLNIGNKVGFGSSVTTLIE